MLYVKYYWAKLHNFKKNTNLPVLTILYYYTSGVQMYKLKSEIHEQLYSFILLHPIFTWFSVLFPFAKVVKNSNNNKFTSGQFFFSYTKPFLNLVYWGLRTNLLKMLHLIKYLYYENNIQPPQSENIFNSFFHLIWKLYLTTLLAW